MINERIQELINLAQNMGYITYTNYLTPNDYLFFEDKYEDLIIKKSGKLRKMLAFVPNYFSENDVIFPETLIKISVNNKFRKYTNKDFLGSIMGLNIDRKYIGDIFQIDDNIAYVYVENKVLDIICNNLTKIAKNTCEISIINEKIDLDFKYEIKKYTISSVRLDNIVSAITGMSRTKAKEYIQFGLCKINYDDCIDASKTIKEGSIISMKGYGRYIYSGIVKYSKKEKPVIEIKTFI
ncbi:YlmH/Sll1252 family protein [Oceanivirga salmonicida]|uniref:YlmH/Sll1252 family protein n=1 Tax=Oceanivirga salmonicida TaxID=1769291 RepID=UPI000836E183|nr:YlmH/Sll1252 family protein [Oceanivirga salmonicida]